MGIRSYRLKTCNALRLEDLHGVGLDLVVAAYQPIRQGKACVEADHVLGFLFRHGPDYLRTAWSANC
ncbi:MAG: hypothetical protein CV088_14855 [Nitrospira sp. LK70]|nr:hypothetical protein [Nitrospira sp. LK70]